MAKEGTASEKNLRCPHWKTFYLIHSAQKRRKDTMPNDASAGDLVMVANTGIIIHMAGRGKDNSQAGINNAIRPLFRPINQWKKKKKRISGEGALLHTVYSVWPGRWWQKGWPPWKRQTAPSMERESDRWFQKTGKMKGYILSGPEYLTVFNGLTGVIIHTTDYVPPPSSCQIKSHFGMNWRAVVWGDGYGNRMDHFPCPCGYLDGLCIPAWWCAVVIIPGPF